jgi:hypothetical protein
MVQQRLPFTAQMGELSLSICLSSTLGYASCEGPLSDDQLGVHGQEVAGSCQPRSTSLATKGILDRQRPKLLAVLKIFTEQNLTPGILGRRHDQRVVDG